MCNSIKTNTEVKCEIESTRYALISSIHKAEIERRKFMFNQIKPKNDNNSTSNKNIR